MNNHTKSSRFIIFLGCAVINFSCFAQENAGAQEEGVAKIEAKRPNMPELFFTAEQRRILEAIRQGAISEESLQIDEFVPLILVEEIFSTAEVLNDEPEQRTKNISVDAFIYNNNKKRAILWLNGKPYNPQEKNAFLDNEGISEVSVLKPHAGEIVGTDQANNSKFVIRVGQKLSRDGGVDETYPVVVVKKR